MAKVYINKTPMSFASIKIDSKGFSFENICSTTSPGLMYNICFSYDDFAGIEYFISLSRSSLIVIKLMNKSLLKCINWIQDKNYGSSEIQERFVTLESQLITNQTIWKIKFFALKSRNCRVVEMNYDIAKQTIKYVNGTDCEDINETSINWLSLAGPSKTNQASRKRGLSQELNHKNMIEKNSHQFVQKSGDNQFELSGKDMDCLRKGNDLNDNIVNHYIDFLKKKEPNQKQLEDIHVFDALFSKRLFFEPVYGKIEEDKSFANNYRKFVKLWTKKVNIFSKNFVIIPIVRNGHWSMVILCFVSQFLSNSSSEAREFKQPLIIIMNSLNGADGLTEDEKFILFRLIEYIRLELEEKHKLIFTNKVLAEFIHYRIPALPRQSNANDCGLFVLEYFKLFIEAPYHLYKKIYEQQNMRDWFNSEEIQTFRRTNIYNDILGDLSLELRNKIKEEIKNYKKPSS